MSTKQHDVEVILKLYELRRDEMVRRARNWYFSEFNPESAKDIVKLMLSSPEQSAYYRMITSYWDMAASFVNHGAIEAEMFNDTVGEHMMVFAKIEPYLAELREMWHEPKAFYHLEKVILDRPNGAEKLKATQEWMKDIQAKMAGGQTSEASA